MRLFLASVARHTNAISNLEKFIGGSFSGKSIAYIPTAANGEGYGGWRGGESIKVASKLGAELTVVELEQYRFADPISALTGKDILWFAGGMCGYLLYWIRRIKLDTKLPELLKHSVYVGSSAGSMITGTDMRYVEWFLGDEEPGAGVFPGLGLVDFHIYPHFEKGTEDEIEKKWKNGSVYLLQDDEVITVEDGTVSVIGKKRMIKK